MSRDPRPPARPDERDASGAAARPYEAPTLEELGVLEKVMDEVSQVEDCPW